jgi:hypothetical protein
VQPHRQRLRDVVLVSYYQRQVKIAELPLDSYRMLLVGAPCLCALRCRNCLLGCCCAKLRGHAVAMLCCLRQAVQAPARHVLCAVLCCAG